MPYKKKRNYRRRYKKKGCVPFYKRKYSAMEIATKAYQGVKYVKGLVNSEMFKKDHSVDAVGIDNSTGLVYPLTDVAVGDHQTNRTGNSILGKYVFGRYQIVQHAAASQTNVRVLIVQDKQQIADTYPTLNDVLETVTPLSSLDTARFPGRFNVLYSKNIILDSASRTIDFDKVRIDYSTHVKYNGTASTDIAKNGIYFMLISDEATNVPYLSSRLKFSFHDN